MLHETMMHLTVHCSKILASSIVITKYFIFLWNPKKCSYHQSKVAKPTTENSCALKLANIEFDGILFFAISLNCNILFWT